MAHWLEETLAAVGILIFVASILVISSVGELLIGA